jgi:hypothetical protein
MKESIDTMTTSYSPVQYVFREIIDEQILEQAEGKVFFFDDDNKVDSWEGKLLRMNEIPQQGIFIFMAPEKQIRIDRIITLFGKPGAAFDEYDSYGNQCLSCTGGYDPDKL